MASSLRTKRAKVSELTPAMTGVRTILPNGQFTAKLINEEYLCGVFPLECPSGFLNIRRQLEAEGSAE